MVRGVLERDAEARVPPAQLGGAGGVLGEEDVVDRVLDLLRASREVRLDERVDARRVGVGQGTPLGRGEHLHQSEASAWGHSGGH